MNPRTIPEVLHLIEKIKGYDKLWIRNFDQVTAYREVRKWFLDLKEYTHMVLLIDDVIITQTEFDVLRKDVEEGDYQVIGGIGNVTYQRLDEFSPCIEMPGFQEHSYKFMKKQEIEEYLKRGEYIKQVKFEGFSLPFIRRDVMERVAFRGENSVDTWFSMDLEERGIPCYVDFRAKMFHLKYHSAPEMALNVGKKAEVIFEPAHS
jgi:hypothetical protein